MKRLTFMTIIAALFTTGLVLIHCSKPLDSPLDPYSSATDTLFLVDTVITSDTIITTDTIFGADTIIVTDTLVSTDTIVLVDTITVIDTITDTISQSDTVTVTDTLTDTVTYTDTVIVDIIDTVFVPTGYCASMSSNQREILWMFQNEAGSYTLEFVAMIDKDKPPTDLIIDINGELFEWNPSESMVLEIEQNLGENAYARIWSGSPHAFGHPATICLKITEM